MGTYLKMMMYNNGNAKSAYSCQLRLISFHPFSAYHPNQVMVIPTGPVIEV
ncbi:hypothetical protein ACFQV5_12065 [Paenibacillus sp. GCM10028914]